MSFSQSRCTPHFQGSHPVYVKNYNNVEIKENKRQSLGVKETHNARNLQSLINNFDLMR